MTITDISEKLRAMSQKLETGDLDPNEILEMTELARQFHERMIILQYKAFEETVKVDEGQQNEVHEPSINSTEKSSTTADSAEIHEEISPNQISLIDSIEEIKRMEQSLNDTLRDDRGVSLRQKLNKKPIQDLKSAISINQQFLFISRLFDNDKEAYAAAVSRINGFSSFLEADEYIQNTLVQRYDWEVRSPEVAEFNGLVERRFL
jgi:molecular chaperone DnaK (HSP70)